MMFNRLLDLFKKPKSSLGVKVRLTAQKANDDRPIQDECLGDCACIVANKYDAPRENDCKNSKNSQEE